MAGLGPNTQHPKLSSKENNPEWSKFSPITQIGNAVVYFILSLVQFYIPVMISRYRYSPLIRSPCVATSRCEGTRSATHMHGLNREMKCQALPCLKRKVLDQSVRQQYSSSKQSNSNSLLAIIPTIRVLQQSVQQQQSSSNQSNRNIPTAFSPNTNNPSTAIPSKCPLHVRVLSL